MNDPRAHRPVRCRPLAAMLLLLPVACALLGGGSQGRHGWRADRGAVVPHDSFPADCSLCHLGDGWDRLRADFVYDHAAETGVPLHGAHRQAQCLRCHNDRGPVAIYAARGCVGCHEDVHQGRLGDCQSCHDQNDWQPAEQISRHASTRLPLIGAHTAVACFRCHPGAQVGNFQRADPRCESCHRQDLARAVDPDHRALGWIADCQDCHSPTAWRRGSVDHSFFPLTGGHAGRACADCHRGGGFGGLSRACVSCHAADYDRVRDPDHRALGFPVTCDDCHTTTTWSGGRFDHRFPLRGPHSQSCSVCHDRSGSSAYTCLVCHEHSRTRMDDKHREVGGYVYESTACVRCHPNGR